MMLGGLTQQYRKLYESSWTAIEKYVLFRPMTQDNADILFTGDAWFNSLKKTTLDGRVQHLSCFAGGMVGMGAKIFDRPKDMSTARKLVDGCIWAYDGQVSGLMPEVSHIVPCEKVDQCEWDKKKWYHAVSERQTMKDGASTLTTDEKKEAFIKERRLLPGYASIEDRSYILRPEAIESVFLLYRMTGDTSLLEAAWRMFTAIEKQTRTNIASAGITDVTLDKSAQSDRMESFWLAETLKYFYLIFAEPDLVSLDQYVLNTEAHPFKRPQAS